MSNEKQLLNYAPGVYIVTKDKYSRGATRIMRVEEVEDGNVFPFAKICKKNLDKLASFLAQVSYKYFLDTFVIDYKNKSIKWEVPSAHDKARDILYFLGLNEEGQENKIKELIKENISVEENGRYKGEVRDGVGRLIYEWHDSSDDALKAKIKYHERILKRLKHDLKENSKEKA